MIAIWTNESTFKYRVGDGNLQIIEQEILKGSIGNRRFYSVDCMKGIAMIMVILVHYSQSFEICKWFGYLQMGCPIFFVASGFGIMCLINKRYEKCLDARNVGRFYLSRFQALAPGWYIAFLIIYVVNTFVLMFSGDTLTLGWNRGIVPIICNLLFLNGWLPFCNNSVMPGGWYIGTTAILYGFTPLMLKAMHIFKNRKIFFLASSFTGMVIWLWLCRTLEESFTHDAFSYYFFLNHYPNYLLGIMLFFDYSDSLLSKTQTKMCLPLGLAAFVCAYVLFYSPIPFQINLSAWTTALATYLVLYYMLSNESSGKHTVIGNILAGFGKNSYYIFLLHTFYTWPFMDLCKKLLCKLGIDIRTYFWFAVFMPIVLGLSYFTGLLLKKTVKCLLAKQFFCGRFPKE